MKDWHRMQSPVGDLILVGENGVLQEIGFTTGKRPTRPPEEGRSNAAAFGEAVRQLEDYFAGRRTTFDLRLAPQGTAFQQRVWKALLKIPFGQAVSYSDIASAIGNPNAMRAVGLANGRNPIPIVIPCHRVIGKNGTLTGYGGGLPIKQKLLALEGFVGVKQRSML